MTKSAENLNQVLSLMTVALNELTTGIANGWIAPTLHSLEGPNAEFNITMEENSWLASLDDFGKIPGAIFTALLLDILGRRILLASSALVFFLVWVITIFTKSVPVLCLMRFLLGFFFGVNEGTNSTYLAENSSPFIRGTFGAICVTLYYIGLLADFIIATYFSYRTTSIINTVVTFLAFISVLWIKEPVQFLLMKGNIKQAEKNYIWLQGGQVSNDNVNIEFQRIKQNVEAENLKTSSFKKIFTAPANYKSLFIMTTIHILVGCTGYYPVMCYASMAFSATEILTSNEFTILFGIAQALIVIPSSFFITRFNRRSIMLISFALIALSHCTTIGLYHVNSNVAEVPYFPWLIFISITFYASVYAFVFPVIFVIRGELFPMSVKATGGCLSVIAYSATGFLTVNVFLAISHAYGIEANFLLYLVFTLITIIFVYCWLPETKNKTLVEIQEMLEKFK